MLTDQDIVKLIEAHKEVFPTKDDFDYLRESFSELQTAVVSFAAQSKTNAGEIVAVNYRLTKVEGWSKEAGAKIGLEYKP